MRLVRGLSVKLVVLLFAATVACAAAPAGAGPGKPIARGVYAGQVELTGLTAQPARERLRREYARPLRFRVGEERWRVPATRFLLASDVDDAVRRALQARPGEAITVDMELDRDELKAYAAEVARRFAQPARNAELTGLDGRLRPVFAAPAQGRRVDVSALRHAIRNSLVSGRRDPIRLRFVPVAPEVTERNFGPIVVIRRSSNTLMLLNGKRPVRTFRVATGTSGYPTPLGRFEIVDKQYHPWWYPPPSDWARGLSPVPPGPGNPLGTRWIGLNSPGIGIHGTPNSASIGTAASHGCIRMHVSESEWIFERVYHGTPVFIVPS